MQWRFIDEGLVAGGQSGSSRNYTNPQLVAASPWNITNNGLDLRFEFEPSENCESDGGSDFRQIGIATSIINVALPTNITFDWIGEGETKASGYEIMTLYVNGVSVATASSPGASGQGDCDTSPVHSSPQPPLTVLLTTGSHEIRITLDTKDKSYHLGAFYEFHLTLHSNRLTDM